LSEPGDVVLDPFCGSGTSGIEAALMGRRAWMSDINSASIQVTLGKVAALRSQEHLGDMYKVASGLVWESILVSDELGRNGEGGSPELFDWFHKDTISELRYLWRIIESTSNSLLRQILEMIFVDALFACAGGPDLKTKTGKRRRHHWGWVADNVKPRHLSPRDAIGAFRTRLHHLIAVLEALPHSIRPDISVRQLDARSLRPDLGRANLVVTSPPYLGMIDYAKANRLTYLWMGWDLVDEMRQEIGARYRRHGHRTSEAYFSDIEQCAVAISSCLVDNGYCALVIGSSRRHPTAAERVVELFASHLDLVWGPRRRTPTRRRVGDRAGTEPTELLCVLKQCG
jgi:hypothetical protein